MLIAISLILLTSGCGKKSSEDLLNKFTNTVNNTKSYILKGNMEILSNEETFTYSIEADYLKDDFYKVTLVNQTNNHEQIILRNKDGVYVITPSLNKSFKFQSEWPDSSSQSYILSSLLKDIKASKEEKLEKTEDGYVLKTKVDYPNNADLNYQKIYFDKDMNLEGVQVYNDDDTVIIKVNFTSINLKAGLKEDDFLLEDLIDTSINNKNPNSNNDKNSSNNNSNTNNSTNNDKNSQNNTNCTNEECDTKSSNILDSIIYPLYIPSETYLSNSEKIDTDSGNRVILTFAGDKNFVLIEEVATVSSEFEIIPVYGEPLVLSETVGAISANSLSFDVNDISYYLASTELSKAEMQLIANSLGNATLVAGIK